MFPIKSVSDLERISKKAKWQYFEKLVAFIFDRNDFETKQNSVIVFGKTKRQFDVIAERFGTVFLVECKKWSKFNASAVKQAAKKHMERCLLFGSQNKEKNILPVIVTLLEGETKMHDDMPVIPIDKLNSFINSFEDIPGRSTPVAGHVLRGHRTVADRIIAL